MKVEVECASCVLHRGYSEILEATNDKALQFRAMAALTRLLGQEFKTSTVAAKLGTQRDRLIKEVTGNRDPYEKKKWLSNKRALGILPQAKKFIADAQSAQNRFRRACLCAMTGNVIEFDIPQHEFQFDDLGRLIQQAEAELAVDEIAQTYNLARQAKEILYLTDNAGEIVFDTLLVKELTNLGAHVTVVVKGKPILNDATMQDAKAVGMHEVASDIITTGTDTVGLFPTECSKRFLSHYKTAELVVAKGMGYAETLTELKLKVPHALLLRTKCQPVANYFGVAKKRNIAKLMT